MTTRAERIEEAARKMMGEQSPREETGCAPGTCSACDLHDALALPPDAPMPPSERDERERALVIEGMRAGTQHPKGWAVSVESVGRVVDDMEAVIAAVDRTHPRPAPTSDALAIVQRMIAAREKDARRDVGYQTNLAAVEYSVLEELACELEGLSKQSVPSLSTALAVERERGAGPVLVTDGERALVQLAGCLTVAEGHTSADVVAQVDAYGWSLAYQRTLDLRRAFDSLAGGRSPRQVLTHPRPAPTSDVLAEERERCAECVEALGSGGWLTPEAASRAIRALGPAAPRPSLASALAAERERCARECEAFAKSEEDAAGAWTYASNGALACAARIRALGAQSPEADEGAPGPETGAAPPPCGICGGPTTWALERPHKKRWQCAACNTRPAPDCSRDGHRFALRQTTGRETCIDCFAEEDGHEPHEHGLPLTPGEAWGSASRPAPDASQAAMREWAWNFYCDLVGERDPNMSEADFDASLLRCGPPPAHDVRNHPLVLDLRWQIERIEEEVRGAGMEVQWTDGGGNKAPSGWARNPYINASQPAHDDALLMRVAEMTRDAVERAYVKAQNALRVHLAVEPVDINAIVQRAKAAGGES